MPILVYFAAGADRWPDYASILPAALARAGLEAEITLRPNDPAKVDYIVFAPGGDITDFTPYTRARAVLGLWAGVERIVTNPTLTQPLARMVDSGLTWGMTEWVVGQVLRHHLGLDRYSCARAPHWDRHVPPLAPSRRVTVLGLGELGREAATALAALRFDVTGWSRSPRTVAGVRCLHGDGGLHHALEAAEILVTLLPLTPQTEGVLDAQALARLPRGAVVINPGRGGLIDDDALLAALRTGHVGHATLDVFCTEPLPTDHPYWSQPNVTITPHVAAETRPASSVHAIADNIRRDQAGLPLIGLVDRAQGY